MTLGRPATGLPRYYLDVGWWRHPRYAGLTLEALWCWQAAISYCTHHGTDGRMPSDPEELSLAIGVRLTIVRKGLRQLTAKGIWTVDGHELVIDGYEDHNPISAEVAEHAERQRTRGALGNHRRWHERRGVVDPDCPYCTSPGESLGDDRQATSPEGSPGGPSPGESLGMGWDGMGTSSSDGFTTGDIAPDDDQAERPDQGNHHATVETALAILAQRDLDERQRADHLSALGDPESWLRIATGRRRSRHAQHLADLAAQRPTATAADLAAAIEPAPGPATSPPPATVDGAPFMPGAGALTGPTPLPDEHDPDPAGTARAAARQALRHPRRSAQ